MNVHVTGTDDEYGQDFTVSLSYVGLVDGHDQEALYEMDSRETPGGMFGYPANQASLSFNLPLNGNCEVEIVPLSGGSIRTVILDQQSMTLSQNFILRLRTVPVFFSSALQRDFGRKRSRPKLGAHITEEYAPSRRQALNKMYMYEGVHLLSAAATEIQNSEVLWQGDSFRKIARTLNEVYLGHMVQNKTGTVSYKVHKQVSKPKENGIKVEHTHEALVSQEVWDAVQRLDNHPSKGRSGQRWQQWTSGWRNWKSWWSPPMRTR